MLKRKCFVLMILDGWGYRKEYSHNPIQQVPTPTVDYILSRYPHMLLNASGRAVGLPEGQIGNSEVGHLHLGAGRKVPQDLVRIHDAVQNGTFQKNSSFLQAIQAAKNNNSAIHIVGLLSPGGVHSHENHIQALIKMIGGHGIKKNYFHAILDGRDTPPKSALSSLQKIENLYHSLPGGQIASVIGRYFAMDRDKRWDRTKKAYDLLTLGKADYSASTAEIALKMAYERNETDEFVSPTTICSNHNPTFIQSRDVVIFMNFRADRARQLTHALTDPQFDAFARQKISQLAEFVTLTHYIDNPFIQIAYPPFGITNTLGEFLSTQGLSQLRIAETEKYAHVTYFFNGGIEAPFSREYRLLIPSPKVATYDLQPEMSAYTLTDELLKAIRSNQYDCIICNYANPDMIGHTGVEEAAKKVIRVMDDCLHRIFQTIKDTQNELCITADHGNIEMMFDEKTKQPHTAHTTNLVPFIYIGRSAHCIQKTGALDDVAPTLLYLMGFTPPKEMTGKILLQLDA